MITKTRIRGGAIWLRTISVPAVMPFEKLKYFSDSRPRISSPCTPVRLLPCLCIQIQFPNTANYCCSFVRCANNGGGGGSGDDGDDGPAQKTERKWFGAHAPPTATRCHCGHSRRMQTSRRTKARKTANRIIIHATRSRRK